MEWKNSNRRKPLVLQGARQVGKTHLLKKFAKESYPESAYFNFEEDPALADFFSLKLTPAGILEKLSIYRGTKILPKETLLIFDEVQACPAALNSLKYFQEQAPEYHVAAAGSLLGIELNREGSFPVGKVNFLSLFPLCFFEFLDALGKSAARKMLENIEEITPLPLAIHEELLELLRVYVFTGGMPEVVSTYAETRDFAVVRGVQNDIINSYLLDFSKHAEKTDVLKITRIWESIPAHLGRENKKFIFSAISKSARAREYESALQWLKDAGIIYKVHGIETPQVPLQSYQDNDRFKVYLLDVGLLGAMMRLPAETIIHGNNLFTHAKGALTENLVAQELSEHLRQPLHYWTSQGTAEVDFLISVLMNGRETIVPIEAKAGESTKNKSLTEYGKNFHPPVLIRTGTRNLKLDARMLNLPHYALGALPGILRLIPDLVAGR